MANRMTTKQLTDSFLDELRTMPTDFPAAKWAEKMIKFACEQYYAFGRKGTYTAYARALHEAIMSHPASTVHTEYVADWISGKTYEECWHFDKCCR